MADMLGSLYIGVLDEGWMGVTERLEGELDGDAMGILEGPAADEKGRWSDSKWPC